MNRLREIATEICVTVVFLKIRLYLDRISFIGFSTSKDAFFEEKFQHLFNTIIKLCNNLFDQYSQYAFFVTKKHTV